MKKTSLVIFLLLFLAGCSINNQQIDQNSTNSQLVNTTSAPTFSINPISASYQTVDSTSTQPEVHTYFSFDADAKRNRVSVNESVFFFIDGNNDLYTITDDTDAKIVLNNVVEVTQNAPEYFAVTSDGSLWSWSDGYYGCLGREVNDSDNYSSMFKPEKILDHVSHVYISGYFCYAILNDGSLWGWGWGKMHDLYLGDGTKTGSIEPVKILDNIDSIVEVQAESYGSGASNMFAIKTDGSLWAWGTNEEGALGLGNIKDVLVPMKVMDDVESFVPGDNSRFYIHSVFNYAIKKDGSLWAWGQGKHGNLGNDSTADSNIPVKIMDNVKAADIGMALKDDGSLWVWGAQTHTVNYTPTYTSVPVKVLDNVSEAHVHDYTYYAVTMDNELYIFDYEGRFTLQDGKVTYSNGTPEKLMDGVRHVFVEDQYGCGLGARVYVEKTDGSLWSWGKDFSLNADGALDDDDYNKTWYNKPQELMQKPIVYREYTGNEIEYVITDDGHLWWYMLNSSESAPIQSGEITDNVAQVVAGYNDALILKKDGSLYIVNCS